MNIVVYTVQHMMSYLERECDHFEYEMIGDCTSPLALQNIGIHVDCKIQHDEIRQKTRLETLESLFEDEIVVA